MTKFIFLDNKHEADDNMLIKENINFLKVDTEATFAQNLKKCKLE